MAAASSSASPHPADTSRDLLFRWAERRVSVCVNRCTIDFDLFVGKGAFGAVYIGSLAASSESDPVKVAVKVLRTATPLTELDRELEVRDRVGRPCLPVLFAGSNVVAVCVPFKGTCVRHVKVGVGTS